MAGPVIDAETLSEFLGKAEPLLMEALIDSFVARLDRRIESAEAVFARVRQGTNKHLEGFWNMVPATKKLTQEERETHDDLAWSLLKPAIDRDAAAVFQVLDNLTDRPKWAIEWATFWLYLASPNQFPWWPRWLYNSETQTGALLLVLADPTAFSANDTTEMGLETYRKINGVANQLAAVIEATRRMTRIPEQHRVLLCFSWVYAVYMFTMASWRMTSEFTQILPPFPKVVEGLLGIKHREGVALEQ